VTEDIPLEVYELMDLFPQTSQVDRASSSYRSVHGPTAGGAPAGDRSSG